MEFTIYLQEVPVTINSREGKKTYTLRELDGAGRNQWLNELSDRTKKDESGKVVGVKDTEGVQESLISKCLYDDRGNLVTKEAVSSWPAKTVDAIFKACMKMNALDDEGEEQAKKD